MREGDALFIPRGWLPAVDRNEPPLDADLAGERRAWRKGRHDDGRAPVARERDAELAGRSRHRDRAHAEALIIRSDSSPSPVPPRPEGPPPGAVAAG